MKALGRAGGKARHQPGKQLPADQRDTVRAELRKIDPATVRLGVEEALAGGNVTAKVQAVRLLSDLEVYRRDGDDCPRCAQVKAEAPAVRDKLDRLLEAHFVRAVQDHDAGKVRGEHDSPAMALVRRAVARAREGHEEELQAVVEQALLKTVERLKHANIVVDKDVSPEEARAVLQTLAEMGVFDHLIEGRMKQEREALDREREELAAQRAEFAGA